MFVRCHRIIIQWQRMIVRQRRTKKHTVCDKEFIGIRESIHIDNTEFTIRNMPKRILALFLKLIPITVPFCVHRHMVVFYHGNAEEPFRYEELDGITLVYPCVSFLLDLKLVDWAIDKPYFHIVHIVRLASRITVSPHTARLVTHFLIFLLHNRISHATLLIVGKSVITDVEHRQAKDARTNRTA